MSRRRYRLRTRRRRTGNAIAQVVVVAALTFAVATGVLHASAGVAVVVAAFAAGFLLRGRVRVPYLRTGWRRMR